MQDFKCTNPADMKYKQLAQRASYFKENKEEVAQCLNLSVEEVEDIVANLSK